LKSGKEAKRMPHWLPQVLLARWMGVMPSAIDDEPLEWVTRLFELHCQATKMDIEL